MSNESGDDKLLATRENKDYRTNLLKRNFTEIIGCRVLQSVGREKNCKSNETRWLFHDEDNFSGEPEDGRAFALSHKELLYRLLYTLMTAIYDRCSERQYARLDTAKYRAESTRRKKLSTTTCFHPFSLLALSGSRGDRRSK